VSTNLLSLSRGLNSNGTETYAKFLNTFSRWFMPWQRPYVHQQWFNPILLP